MRWRSRDDPRCDDGPRDGGGLSADYLISCGLIFNAHLKRAVCCFLVAKRILDARISQTGARVFIPDDDRWLKDFARSWWGVAA